MNETTVTIVLDRSELAGRLGVGRERLVLELLTGASGKAREPIVFRVFVDGRGLTPVQKEVVRVFLAEKLKAIVSFPKGGTA